VHPWVTAEHDVLPHNRKDAYLVAAVELYKPTVLLTFDKSLLDLDFIGKTVVATPALVLSTWDATDEGEL
jgi:predicted nucleic acid-binding protein